MSGPKVSVIVPVFNGEAYVSDCIESLLAQTLRGIEIILIDDGSIDETNRICREYALSDKRITVVQQENSGVSAARNAGLRIAKGEYLAFADADDMMLGDGIENLFRAAEQCGADIVFGGYLVGNSNYHREVQPQELLPRVDVLCSVLNGANHSAFWNKLIRRSSLGELRFPQDIRYAEDQVLLVEFLATRPRVISYVPSPVYFHRDSHGSVTRSGGRSLLDLLDAKIRIAKTLAASGMQEATKICFSDGASKAVISVVRNIDGALLGLAIDRLEAYSGSLRSAGFASRVSVVPRIILAISHLPKTFSVFLFRSIRLAGSCASATRNSQLRMRRTR